MTSTSEFRLWHVRVLKKLRQSSVPDFGVRSCSPRTNTRGQTRKASTIPYIAQLMGVASLVLEAGGDEDMAIAALLHDVVEDCGGAPMLNEVRRRFGDRVATIVYGCTDADTYPKPPWRERKEKYIRRLRKESAETRLVSGADKLNNIRSILSDYRDIGESVWSRFNGGREGTLWYYRTLCDEFLQHERNRITTDFELAVKELESLVERKAISAGGAEV